MKSEELLNKYFLEGLNKEEMEIFNHLLENDLKFKKQFELEKSLQLIVKGKRRKVLKNEVLKLRLSNKQKNDYINEIDKERWIDSLLFQEEKSNKKTIFKIRKGMYWVKWAVAASILFFISFYFYNYRFNNVSEKLYALHFEKYPNTIYPIEKSGSQENSIELKAFIAYELDNFEKSIELFKQLKSEQDLDYVDFYMGLSYLQNDQIEESKNRFKMVIKRDEKFSDEALWYLSLVHLKNNENKKALVSLTRIVNNKSYKHKEAQSIKNALE
ncbi:hypothetical protein D1816_17695 [Aquimarina sp. AD10]|uniref:tetratricopeptide repeat protein n=1 Tax=Aquimarina sp. AD10 TaxID=1714849 RepID=UPI000E4D1673|nr:hypothetical protein [Aquimarina sp. AD10]AXT62114.1 hypothetical protein D1816_17695 [Aquimarina sp. AD10]RKM99898.1 hypothetical protein D7033_09885 [Aquimarina sp. AD10]